MLKWSKMAIHVVLSLQFRNLGSSAVYSKRLQECFIKTMELEWQILLLTVPMQK